MKRGVKILVCVIAIILISISQLTPRAGNRFMVITSGSMEPTIQTNALILVHTCSVSDLRDGDIVTYYHPGLRSLVTHRVIQKGEDWVLTQGDANDIHDDVKVVDDNLYGKVVLVMNWMVPIVERMSDQRTTVISALITLFIIMMALWCIIAFVATYVYALHIVFHRPPTEQEIADVFGEQQREMYAKFRSSSQLTIIQRVRLQVLYRTYKRRTEKAQKQLDSIIHRK